MVNHVTFDDDNFEVDILDDVRFTVPIAHNELNGRDADDSHPISAIEGLTEELEAVEDHVQNEEIHVTAHEKEVWNNKSRIYRNASGALVISV